MNLQVRAGKHSRVCLASGRLPVVHSCTFKRAIEKKWYPNRPQEEMLKFTAAATTVEEPRELPQQSPPVSEIVLWGASERMPERLSLPPDTYAYTDDVNL